MKKIAIWAKGKLQAIKSWLAVSKKRQRITAIGVVLIIALAGQIIYSSFAATTEYSQIPEVAKMQKLTEEVVKLADEYAAMPDVINGKKAANQPNEMKATRGKALVAKVQERREAYLVALQYDPQAAADAYFRQATINKLPTDAKFYLEQPMVLEGRWISGRISNDAEEGQTSIQERQSVQVMLTDESRVSIYGTNLPDYETGAPVKLFGSRMGSSFIAALPRIITPNPPTPGSAIPPEVIDELNTAYQEILEQLEDIVEEGGSYTEVVYCAPQNEVSCFRSDDDPVTDIADAKKNILIVVYRFPGAVANQLRTQRTYPSLEEVGLYAQSMVSAYEKMSYGKFKPTFTVYPQYVDLAATEDIDLANLDCVGGTAQADIEVATQHTINSIPDLQAQGVAATDIVNVLDSAVCDDGTEDIGVHGWAWGGSSSKFGVVIKGISHQIIADKTFSQVTDTMTHEFGHTIGLQHAGGACEEQECLSGDMSDGATKAIYADPYNFMGGQSFDAVEQNWLTRDSKSVNISQKRDLGWVEDTDIACVSGTGGSVKLNALWQSAGTRGISINGSGSTGASTGMCGNIFMEFRPKTAEGTDNFNAGTLTPGILIYTTGSGWAGNQSDQSADARIMNGRVNEAGEWSYAQAGITTSFRIGEGDEVICVTPSNAGEGSVDVRVDLAKACPNDTVTNYVYEKTISYSGNGITASDLEVDNDGNTYILDISTKKVSKVDRDGKLLSSFTVPYDAALNSKMAINSRGEVYLSIRQTLGRYEDKQQVLKFSQDGEELAKWDPGDLRHIQNGISHDYVVDITTDSKDNVYFIYARRTQAAWSDFTQSIVMKFDGNLNEAHRWYLTNQFIGTSLGIDKDDNIYAFEEGRYNHSLTGWHNLPENCINKFSSQGENLSRWCKSNPRVAGNPMDYYNTSNDVFVAFNHMELDKTGNYLLLPTSYNKNIAMYGSGHQYVGRIGIDLGTFRAIELAPDGKLYAPISQEPAMRVFSPEATPIEYTELTN